MLTKTIFTATFFALASFTVATPPGCLLGAVNTYDTPADLKSVCSAKDATTTIAKFCGGSTKQALEAFADICNGAGVKVSTDVPKVSGSVSVTPTASASGSKASATGSFAVQPSGNATVPAATGGPRASGTGAGASGTSSGRTPVSTGAAGRLEIGVVAALAGIFAVAL